MYPFKEGSFAVRNGWYVAAFVQDVGRALVSRTILNEPVVLYRREDGTAVAVGGRCPHRHFPLGKSCLQGDTIVCGYHGIAFGADGRCVDIPSQAFVPKSYRIPTYPLVEHGIWLWIWMGDPDKADTALLPDLAAIGVETPGMITRPFYFHEIACRYQLLNDNLLDLSHLGFLHGTTIGTRENTSTPEELTKRPGLLTSRRILRNAPAPAVMAAVGHGHVDTVDRVVGMDFHLPGFHAGIGDNLYPMDHPEHPGEIISTTRIFHAVTPSTPHSSYYHFAMASPSQADLDARQEYLKAVIEEDVFASIEIEKMLALVGEDRPEYMLKSDTNAVEGRRMLQAMMDAEAAGAVTEAA